MTIASLQGPDHNIGMIFYDGDGDYFHTYPQTNRGDNLQDIRIYPDKFPEPSIMNSLPDGRNGYIQGWEFEYRGEKWTTNDERHCSVGEEVVSGYARERTMQLPYGGFSCKRR